MILKTYTRVLTEDMEATLAVLTPLVGAEPDLRVQFRRFEVAFTGGFCVLSGPAEAMDRYRDTVGPVIVDDLETVRAAVTINGAKPTMEPFEGPAGRVFLARHPDGLEYEYIELSPEMSKTAAGSAPA